MEIDYTQNNTKIYDGYKYSNSEIDKAVDEIIKTRKELGLPVTRSKSSYVSEWKSHNRLYKLGFEKNRTKDVDLEEDIKPVRNFLYSLFGF
jgi:aryl-phospho-beta-D-glucosidase BglC (GH1 family)